MAGFSKIPKADEYGVASFKPSFSLLHLVPSSLGLNSTWLEALGDKVRSFFLRSTAAIIVQFRNAVFSL